MNGSVSPLIDPPQTSRRRIGAFLLVALVCILAPFLLCSRRGPAAPSDDGRRALVFDSDAWLAAGRPERQPADSGERHVRARMIESLLAGTVLDDASANDIARLLGAPDGTRPDEVGGQPFPVEGPVLGRQVASRWFYDLGEAGANGGRRWLVLDFDESTRLVSRTLYEG